MSSLPGAHANFGSDSSSRRHAENSGVSRAALTRTTRGDGDLPTYRMVMNTGENRRRIRVLRACAIPALNLLGVSDCDLESARFLLDSLIAPRQVYITPRL